jgi:hypothetical protein
MQSRIEWGNFSTQPIAWRQPQDNESSRNLEPEAHSSLPHDIESSAYLQNEISATLRRGDCIERLISSEQNAELFQWR